MGVTLAPFDLSGAKLASKTRRIGTGDIGGKAKGFMLGREILLSDEVSRRFPEVRPLFRFPISFCVCFDVFDQFLQDNTLAPFVERCRDTPDDELYRELREAFLKAVFPEKITEELRTLLKTVPFPLAVRSSSFLEDHQGTSFAGKYETTFIANRGELDVRLDQLLTAIKGVYASTYNPNAVTYRQKRGLIDVRERMAILLQEAIGREFEGKFLPLMAGVGFSKNDYCWSENVRREEGLVRIVFGLGTRAVGRGYARIFSPGKPLLRPEGMGAAEIDRFSQATIDALDLTTSTLVSFHFSEVVKDAQHCYPRADRLFSFRDGNYLYRPVSNVWNLAHKPILTFDTVLQAPWLKLHLAPYLRSVLSSLEDGFGCPVDIEFAIRVDDIEDEAHFYLLQARPLSQREEMSPRPLPHDVPEEDKLFSANRNCPSGEVNQIEYIVSVDSRLYLQWPLDKRHEVARLVGRVNTALKKKVFLLMGPGRWGSTNPELGVPVRYSEISYAAMLVEVARKQERYAPEVSFGTHFFQDLIEGQIIYLPMYPDDPGVIFNEPFLRKTNALQEVLGKKYDAAYEDLIRVIHLPAVTGGRCARAVLNAEENKALIYLLPAGA